MSLIKDIGDGKGEEPEGQVKIVRERAGFSVGVSRAIEEDLQLKLLCNIGSTANALVPPADHADPRFGAIKAALTQEAWDAMRRHGIVARSCDGEDASPDEEIRRQAVAGARARPVYNDTWRQLSLGRRPQERYHRTIVALDENAVLNRRMAELLDRATRPECYPIDELARALDWKTNG